ncbi:uncharacterized protein LOC129809680 [Phlebotomus papatasi]|uniref:uncharacterized protein LOC129809680 n=1 Tax=Phlebotomus papatasi TaxID=29031 RepID=UPI0024842E43|nr:uncharacterized protein LOC129809680 [Phlebotomus papatasi]
MILRMSSIPKLLLSFLLLTGAANANVQAPAMINVGTHQANVFPGPKVLEVNKASISPAALDIPANCTNRWDTYCYDCRTIVVCAGEEKPIHAEICPSSTPYCEQYSSATCVVNERYPHEDQMCDSSTPAVSQRCTFYGHTPDANDPRVYYECHGPGDTNPIVHTCPEGYIFDTIDHNCQRIIPFDCRRKDNQFINHALNPAYYAYCQLYENGEREVIPYKCRDDQNFVFNLETKACEYQCKGEGQFLDRESCENYYECYRNGNGFTHKRMRCPDGTPHFRKDLGRCGPHFGMCEPEVGWP